MAKEKAPAFQFYPRDWQTDEYVRRMNLAARGFYWELLGYSWTEGSIPDDIDACTKLVGAPPLICPHCQTSIGAEQFWVDIRARFRSTGTGRLKQKRLEIQRLAQKRYYKAKSTAGEKGSRNRWRLKLIDGSATALPIAQRNAAAIRLPLANDGSSSSSSTSIPPTPLSAENIKAFEVFWEKCPRKTGKDAAARAWISLDLDAIADQVMAGLDRWLASEEWKKENGKFVPSPAKWIADKRWMDHPKPAESDLPDYYRPLRRHR